MTAETCALCSATTPDDLIAMCEPGNNLALCQAHWNTWLDAAIFGPGTPDGVAAHLILGGAA